MPENEKRYYIVFKGRVQGVGFRWTAMNIARNLGLTGWVRNLSNGDVDCEVQGDPKAVIQFISDIRKPDRWIKIDNYSMRQIPVQKDSKGFNARY